MHFAKTKRRRKHLPSETANTQGNGRQQPSSDAVQGEGNYEAAREFNAAQRQFVQSGKVDAAARAAAPKTDDEKRDQWCVRISRATGKDLGPYFEAWGVPVSDAARRQVAELPEWMPDDWPKK